MRKYNIHIPGNRSTLLNSKSDDRLTTSETSSHTGDIDRFTESLVLVPAY